jgi:hypothetical protein
LRLAEGGEIPADLGDEIAAVLGVAAKHRQAYLPTTCDRLT